MSEQATSEIEGTEDLTDQMQTQWYSFPCVLWKREEERDCMGERERRETLQNYSFLDQIQSPESLLMRKISSHGFACLHRQCLMLQFQIKLGEPILERPVGLSKKLLFNFFLGITRI